MVRPGGGAPTPASKRKEKETAPEDTAEETENKRLRDIAFSRGLLSKAKSQAHNPSLPSNTILKSDGRDIVKKGHRKSKYLFAFPGLMSPVAGGKIGELTNLDSKNPVLYIDFPEGRLKLFGTIVYPKNKYLTLHFPRGSGNILCEDCFESLVVFSNAWWVGTKEHNPEEVRLPLPKSLEQVKHADFHFTAGAGQGTETKNHKEKLQFETPKMKPEASGSESSDKDTVVQTCSQPLRQSARTAGKTLKYADTSSDNDNDSDSANSVHSQQILKSKGKQQLQTLKHLSNNMGTKSVENLDYKDTITVDSDDDMTRSRIGTEAAMSAEIKVPTSTDFKRASIKTPIRGSNNKASVIKQSQHDSFHTSQVEGPNTVGALTPKANSKGTSSLPKSAPRSAKRSRKALNEHDLSSGDDLFKAKDTPTERKRAKGQDDTVANKEYVKAAITERTPKNSFLLKEGKAKLELDKETATGSASKPKSSARKSTSAKRPKRKSEAEELSDSSEEPSDDSDEDWAG